jgi:hypothetical protein
MQEHMRMQVPGFEWREMLRRLVSERLALIGTHPDSQQG